MHLVCMAPPGHLLLLACHLLLLAPIFFAGGQICLFHSIKKSTYKCLHSYNWKEVSINHPYKQFNTSIKSPLQVDIYDLLNNPSAIQSRNSFMFTSSSPWCTFDTLPSEEDPSANGTYSLRSVKFVAEGMGVHTKTREERLPNRTCSTDFKFCAAICLH